MKYRDMFADTWSVVIFLLYMILFINQGLIVTSSQQLDKSYNYNTIIVVLLTEIMKLIIALLLYWKSERCSVIFQTLMEHVKLGVLYMVPAFLYCLYNNLAFLNLSRYDPTTYFILLQLRVMITAILFQFIFKKKLTFLQWISLAILTVGCIVKNFSTPRQQNSNNEALSETHPVAVLKNLSSSGTVLILLQVFCSCLAGVYNEKLLKYVGANVDILAQNVFMCFDSILFNAIIVVAHEDVRSLFASDSFYQILRWNVVVIILNNSAIGIVTAFFLKNFNSIVKNYASALELIFTAILSWVQIYSIMFRVIIFGIEVGVWTIVSIMLVVLATFMYVHNPVINHPVVDELGNLKEQTILSTKWKALPK